MKITDVKAIIIRQKEAIRLIGDGSQDSVIIQVETDAGITGYGEVDSSPYIVKAIIECPPSHVVCRGLRDIVIGQDPFDVEKIWEDMYTGSYYYGRRSVGLHAMSGIDMAIWDILGKALHKPVYKLLGGQFHKSLRAYASLLMPDTEKEAAEKADCYLGRGFQAIKFGWGGLGISEEQDIRLVKAARAAMGNLGMMLDIGMLWGTPKYAIHMCQELARFNPYWIEEPVSPDDLSGLARISDCTSLNIAAGEEYTGLHEFRELLERGHVDIVQPDISRCGGITAAKKIAGLASLYNVQFIPHAFKSGVLMAATIQVLAATKTSPWLEFCCQETVISKTLLARPFQIDGEGMVEVPDGDGLGIDLDLERLEYLTVRE